MPSDEDIARAFHDAYERLAPSFGYSTRTSSAKPWAMVPAANKALMIATVGEVRALLGAATTPTAEPTEPMPLRDGDLRKETYFAPDQVVNENPRGVRLTHIPTRTSYGFHGERTAVENEYLARQHLTRWVDQLTPKGRPCSCGRALPCRHCPEETT
jgi:hypothetical protein